MRIRYLSQAIAELDDAILYYNYQLPGLGFQFCEEVDSAIEKIKFMPEAWTQVGRRTRRFLVKHFPYAILYVAEPGQILITAVAHLHRDPQYYMDRMI